MEPEVKRTKKAKPAHIGKWNEEFSDENRFAEAVRRGLPFPLKRMYTSDEQIREMMRYLEKYEPDPEEIEYHLDVDVKHGYQGKSLMLIGKDEDFDRYNTLSDMFSETERMKCKRFDRGMSPYDFFKGRARVLGKMILQGHPKITERTAIETIWRRIGPCTSFRPTNIVSIKKLFFGSRKISILDPSAGWGDRLIGAIATKSSYVGVDPNADMYPNYMEIIRFFKYKPAKIHCMPFEDFRSAERFDLVLTSPPYFDMETYTDQPTQSIKKHTSETAWFEWLKVYLKNASDHLKPAGIMCIVISSKKHERYVQDALNFVGGFMDYRGLIAYGQRPEKAQPMFIWQNMRGTAKNASQNATRADRITRCAILEIHPALRPPGDAIRAGGRRNGLKLVPSAKMAKKGVARLYAIRRADGKTVGYIGYAGKKPRIVATATAYWKPSYATEVANLFARRHGFLKF